LVGKTTAVCQIVISLLILCEGNLFQVHPGATVNHEFLFSGKFPLISPVEYLQISSSTK
jgi:hypothetical protein